MKKSSWSHMVVAVLGIITLAGGFLLPAAEARADEFGVGPPTDGYRADDRNQDYCTIIAWPTDWGYPFVDAMVNLDAQSNMYDTYRSSCGAQTDVRGIRGTNASMGSNTRGSYACDVFFTSTKCDRGTIRVNQDILTDYRQRRKTFCHEVGHSVGLVHYTRSNPSASSTAGEQNDCMASGSVRGEQWWIEYSDHHQAHIDNVYP